MVMVENRPVALHIENFYKFTNEFGQTYEVGDFPKWHFWRNPITRRMPVTDIIQEVANLSSRYYDFRQVDIELWYSDRTKGFFDIACNGRVNDDQVTVIFYTNHPGFSSQKDYDLEVARVLPALTVHELGHVARSRQGNLSFNLCDLVVHEATAMKLQTEVYPDILIPTITCTQEEMRGIREQIAIEGSNDISQVSFRDKWVYGIQNLPARALYALAKDWMDCYSKVTGASVEDFFDVSTEKFMQVVDPQMHQK